ncbi:molybdopterin-dependent oxidoreductase [Amorphus sp. 3PC139-8]|uniref:molybdopterin-dependent oxidoreductase n=1 Tax=Amorphus sp. 3PC139-8 TaxID=2735676 RepID=UPI00345C8A0A
MLPIPNNPTFAAHFGVYRVSRGADGRPVFTGIDRDPAPSRFADGLGAAATSPARVRRPSVRRSVWERGGGANRERRGQEPFVEVSWDEAVALVASELDRVRTRYGNSAIFGGSYGWASAGRYHHAQSQVHRFLNTIGGYVRSIQDYSYGAGLAILPHVIGSTDGLLRGHTPWSLIAGYATLIVMFGGAPERNGAVSPGGVGRHSVRESLATCRDKGAEFVLVSPCRDDLSTDLGAEWISLRPGTDTAMMLAIAHTLVTEGLHDRAFLDRYTVGFDGFCVYLLGTDDGIAKSPDWAAPITGVPAEAIRGLARRMAAERCFVSATWSVQRADRGEQPYWMAIVLAAMLGGIGLPGGGFGFGYGSSNGVGHATHPIRWPSVPQGINPVDDFIPVARLADMLLNPGGSYEFGGECRTYPDIRLVYWAGGNPFHHHQDLNRLARAFHRPETIVVNEIAWTATARHADVVFPVTLPFERNDIACSGRENFLAASHKVSDPSCEARNDVEIFTALADVLGVRDAYTGGWTEEDWLRHLYGEAAERLNEIGIETPDFETFWQEGLITLPDAEPAPLLGRFRADPYRNPLSTPSGRIEICSAEIAGFGYDDCRGHPSWLEPEEWLGAETAKDYPLHLLSCQPSHKLHSQFDFASSSVQAKRDGREVVLINPADAARRGVADGDGVLVYNARGRCFATAQLSDDMRAGVARLPTGAWFTPDEAAGDGDTHGNPNVLTADRGTSRLGQATSANSCLVEIRRLNGSKAHPTAFQPPEMVARSTSARATPDRHPIAAKRERNDL